MSSPIDNYPRSLRPAIRVINRRKEFLKELDVAADAISLEVAALGPRVEENRDLLRRIVVHYYKSLYEVARARAKEGSFPTWFYLEDLVLKCIIDNEETEHLLNFFLTVFEHLPADVSWNKVKEVLERHFPKAALCKVANMFFQGSVWEFDCEDEMGLGDFLLGYHTLWHDPRGLTVPQLVSRGERYPHPLHPRLLGCTPSLVAEKLLENQQTDGKVINLSLWHRAIVKSKDRNYSEFLLHVARDFLTRAPEKATCSDNLKALLDKQAQELAAGLRQELPIDVAKDDMADVVLSFLF